MSTVMRKTKAWLRESGKRTSNTKPMKPETRMRRLRKAVALANNKNPITDQETGTVRYPDPPPGSDR